MRTCTHCVFKSFATFELAFDDILGLAAAVALTMGFVAVCFCKRAVLIHKQLLRFAPLLR